MMPVAPPINGDLSDWSGMAAIRLRPSDHQRVPDDRAQPLEDEAVGGVARVAWDAKHLYLAADVCDTMPMRNSHERAELWCGESLELYLGFDGTTEKTLIAGNSSFQIGCAPTGTSGKPAIWKWKVAGDKADHVRDGATIVAAPTADGYTRDVAIPLSLLGQASPPRSNFIGFAVHLNDAATADGEKPDNVLIWNGDGMNCRDPSQWNVALLE